MVGFMFPTANTIFYDVVREACTVAEWLVRSSLVLKVQGSQHSLCMGFFKTFSVHPAVNGFPKAGEGERR